MEHQYDLRLRQDKQKFLRHVSKGIKDFLLALSRCSFYFLSIYKGQKTVQNEKVPIFSFFEEKDSAQLLVGPHLKVVLNYLLVLAELPENYHFLV